MATTAPVSDLTRRERRKLEVRTRILQAARALFEERGFQATKVAEICELADVAHKTFFNHFPAKQFVVEQLARDGIELLLQELEDARRASTDTGEQIRIFFEDVVAHANDAGPMHRELLTEILHAAVSSPDEPEQAQRLNEAVGVLVDEGRANGHVTNDHSRETIIEMILGAYYSLMFGWVNIEGYPIDRQARGAALFLAEALAPKDNTKRS